LYVLTGDGEKRRREKPGHIVCVNCLISYIFPSKRVTNSEYIVTVEVLFKNFVRCDESVRESVLNTLSCLSVNLHKFLRHNEKETVKYIV